MKRNNLGEWIGFLLGVAVCFAPFVWFYLNREIDFHTGISLWVITIWLSPFFEWIAFKVGQSMCRKK